MSGDQLIAGNTYFLVTYPEPSMCIPIVLTYTYLGLDPQGLEQDELDPQYYFRYLPPIKYDEDMADAENAAGWAEVFPGSFSGWGDSAPTSISAEKLSGFETLDGLIKELTRVRDRLAERQTF